MTTFDYKKEYKPLYFPPQGRFTWVDVPPLDYLMLDGHGDPNHNPQYQVVVEALYSLAYTLKFQLKKAGIEYGVPPLEGLWWMENMAEFSLQTKDRWDWTMMILQPAPVTPEQLEQARAAALHKKGLPELAQVRLERLYEGRAAQVTYLGAYADEGPTIAALHAFIHEQECVRQGKHHEIYLGDPRRTAPEKLKTVIRQPARPAPPAG